MRKLQTKNNNELNTFVFSFLFFFYFYFISFYFFRELRDFKQRLDTMSHELKRKDMQVKELQARLDTGDGCKYTLIDNLESEKCTKVHLLHRYGNIASTLVMQVAAVHVIYLICTCVYFYTSIERVLNSGLVS